MLFFVLYSAEYEIAYDRKWYLHTISVRFSAIKSEPRSLHARRALYHVRSRYHENFTRAAAAVSSVLSRTHHVIYVPVIGIYRRRLRDVWTDPAGTTRKRFARYNNVNTVVGATNVSMSTFPYVFRAEMKTFFSKYIRNKSRVLLQCTHM